MHAPPPPFPKISLLDSSNPLLDFSPGYIEALPCFYSPVLDVFFLDHINSSFSCPSLSLSLENILQYFPECVYTGNNF